MTHPLRRQAGEGGLDQGQVRGAALPEEDERQRGIGGGGEEVPPLDGEEVPAAPQLPARAPQGPQEVPPLRPQRPGPRQPLCRWVTGLVYTHTVYTYAYLCMYVCMYFYIMV